MGASHCVGGGGDGRGKGRAGPGRWWPHLKFSTQQCSQIVNGWGTAARAQLLGEGRPLLQAGVQLRDPRSWLSSMAVSTAISQTLVGETGPTEEAADATSHRTRNCWQPFLGWS